MYLDFLIEMPDVPGKITTKEKGNAVYVNYEVGREYYPDRKYTIPKRVTIGKLSKADEKLPSHRSMARMKKSLEAKIKKAEDRVVKTGKLF